MVFEDDAFISYAHLDNVELIEGRKGWVANLHRALEVRVGQLLGKPPHIWRDPKLQGNDFFGATLVERLRRAALLISVVSPRYVKSEWTRRELSEFWKAAEEQGGVRICDKARIFKVLKTPVPRELHPPELRQFLGYEFFREDPDTGRVRELDEVFGPEAQREFWIKLDDLAHDICCTLEMMDESEGDIAEAASGAVFLAETTFDLRERREDLKRDLQQHGYTVLPAIDLPEVAAGVETLVREDLSRCRMSIHLVGRNYSMVPEGGRASLIEMQTELAIEREQEGGFTRLLWIPPDLAVEDERQRAFIERLRNDPRTQMGADLLESCICDLKTVIHDRLRRGPDSRPASVGPPVSGGEVARIYLIYDQRDAASALASEDLLFHQGFEVVRSLFDGTEAEIREYHEDSLRTCDGALIFYGSGSECWLRRKLRELQKSAGYGRTKPVAALGILLIPPRTPEKERFRTHEAAVLPQFDGFQSGPVLELFACLKHGREAHRE